MRAFNTRGLCIFIMLGLMLISTAIADSSTATTIKIQYRYDAGSWIDLVSVSDSNNISNYWMGTEDNPHDTIAQDGEGDIDFQAVSTCEAAADDPGDADAPTGTCTGDCGGVSTSSLINNYYNINWDGDSTDCNKKGETWFTTLGTWVGSNNACCGDDTTSDDFATHSGSLTTSTSIDCRGCLDGTASSQVTIYGNGYISGSTCYHGDITCNAGSQSSGTSCTLGTYDICSNSVACTSCLPYQKIDTSTCYTDCSTNDDDDCASGYHCNAANDCIADAGTGSACLENSDCSSGYCRDDYDSGKFCSDDSSSCQHDGTDFNNGQISGEYICQSGSWTLASLIIGGRSPIYLNGTIDEVAIYNRSLSSSEAMARYNRGILDMKFSARSCLTGDCSDKGSTWDILCTSPYCDLRSTLSESRYFQFRTLFSTDDLLWTPILTHVNINYSKELPDVVEFIGADTTDFTAEANLESVSDMTLAIEDLKVKWESAINASKQDYDTYINMNDGFISLDVSNLDATINSSANVTIENIDCNDFDLYYATGFHESAISLIEAGSLVATESNVGGNCIDNTLCTNVVCSSDILTFTALHFDGFGTGVIKWVNATNVSEEEFTFIDTELQLGNYTIDDVWVGVVPPAGIEANYSMSNTTSTLYIKDDYNATLVGNYTFTVYVNNTLGEITTENGTFEAVTSNFAPPKVNLSTPTNNTFGFVKRPTFTWDAVTDPDGDNVTYTLELIRTGCYGMSDCENPLVNVTNISSTNYTLTEDLDLDSPYNWTVKAYDGILYGEASGIFNYTVMSLVDITLIVSEVGAAGLEPLQNTSTEDDSPLPLLVQNNGNVFINLSVNASGPLWQMAPLDTEYLRFKAGENSTKPGSFNTTLSVMDWLNMASVHQLVVANLDYEDTRDYAEIELFIKVPHNEPVGAKTTNILISATGTKP